MSKFAKSLIALFAISGAVSMGYGLYLFIAAQIRGAMNFCYKIANVKFISISGDLISFVLDLKFLQNSDFKVTINSYFFNIAINNKLVASIKDTTKIIVLPKAVSLIKTHVKFNPSQFFKLDYLTGLLYTATADQKNFVIQVKGTVNVQLNMLSFKLPIDIKMNLEDIMKPSPTNIKDDKMLTCKIY